MAKVIIICGKICCGKSTYAERLRTENKMILLSVDEIMLSLFGNDAGNMHDIYAERTQNYLFDKSLELLENGISIILDWGFWTKEKRDAVRTFYKTRNIEFELHYIAVCDKEWKRRIEHRNAVVLAGKGNAYYADEGLIAKCSELFEVPDPEEVDVWIGHK